MKYRELTGDDVLRAGDRYRLDCAWRTFFRIPARLIGRRVDSIVDGEYTFRRPLTSAEITAAERKRFEAWCRCDPVVLWNLDRFQDGHAKGNYCDSTVRYMFDAWCQAVNCDPMGDV